ncbi:MAG: hypothetical protein IJL01_06850 [Synergistaceae bacterium]|nr:hypothetical protein [Synergistaceae bacterium]
MFRRFCFVFIFLVITLFCLPVTAAVNRNDKYTGSLLTNCSFYQLGTDEFVMKISGRKLSEPETEFIDDVIQVTLKETRIKNPAGINSSTFNFLETTPLIIDFGIENISGDAVITLKTSRAMKLDSVMRSAEGYSIRIKPLEAQSSFVDAKIIPQRIAKAPENMLPFRVNTRVTVEFRDAELRDIFRMLMSQIGRNIIIDSSFPTDVLVTMSIEDIRIDDVLNHLLRTYNIACFPAGKNTTAFGTKEGLYKLSGANEMKAFKIKYAEASQVKALLVNLANIPDGNIIVDERSRMLYVKTNPAKMEEAEEFISRVDLPMKQIMIRASIFEFTDEDSAAIQNALNIAYDEWQITLGEGAITLDYAEDRSRTGRNPRTARTIQNVFKALEARGKGRVIANPSVTAIDGQQASIQLKQEILYSAGMDDSKNPKWDTKSVGPELRFTPRIEDDRYINLDINIKTGDYIGKDDDDNIRTTDRTVTTKVRVKDGMPFVIGGLFSENTVKVINKIPILGNIPLIGDILFTYRSTDRTKAQAVMVITPYILDSK